MWQYNKFSPVSDTVVIDADAGKSSTNGWTLLYLFAVMLCCGFLQSHSNASPEAAKGQLLSKHSVGKEGSGKKRTDAEGIMLQGRCDLGMHVHV